jgi:hypothetical protein
MNKINRTSLETEKKIWEKPNVLTYGDAVDIIKGVCDNKDVGADDGCTFSGQSIGS